MKRLVKVLCPQCERLITLEVFRVDGAVLIVSCTRCGAESRVESIPATQAAQVSVGNQGARSPSSLPPRVSLASTEGGSNVVVLRTAGHEAVQKAAKAADEGPFAIPDGVCPKCIGPRSTAPACPHCGILFETFDETTVLMPKWLREDWVELLRDWGNEAKHGQLRRKAQQIDGLAPLGRLYRMRQAFVPEDPIAADGRAELLRLAAGAIALRAQPDDGLERRKRTVLIVIVSVFAIFAALMMLGQLARPG
jgi:Zn ribbon nucleic-acid-binding protein